MVTSAHVLERVADRAQLYADFEKPVGGHRADVLSTDEVADIALLVTKVKTDGRTADSVGEAKVGALVFVVGFDDTHLLRSQLKTEQGVVENVGLWADQKHLFIPTGKQTAYSGSAAPALLISGLSCRQGESGSPVFGSQGEILGVMKAFTDKGSCLAMGIGPALALLQRYEE